MVDETTARRRTQTVLLVVLLAISAVVIGAGGWLILSYKLFTQPSSSMEPTLETDSLLVAARGVPVGVGDVVVFRHRGTMWVKRIVAGGGDRVQMKAGLLFVNGVQVPRTEAGLADPGLCWNGNPARRFRETNGRSYLTLDCGPRGDLDQTPEYLVPAGHYFMMGDHRDNSADSRVSVEQGGIGFVAAESVFGKIVSAKDEARP